MATEAMMRELRPLRRRHVGFPDGAGRWRGIATDVGPLADAWMGFATRPGQFQPAARWMLPQQGRVRRHEGRVDRRAALAMTAERPGVAAGAGHATLDGHSPSGASP